MKIKKLSTAARDPIYATPGAACFDLSSIAHFDVLIGPGESYTFDTGLVFEIPQGKAMMIYSRSGHGFNSGVRLCNTTGVIDSDYRGEVKVRLTNDSAAPFKVAPFSRIAQAMLIDAPQVDFEFVEELSDTERGDGGFGSTK
jgi:dUTP pyrophosphatase